jgi:hypothetical protein
MDNGGDYCEGTLRKKAKKTEKKSFFFFKFFSKNKLKTIHSTQWGGSREKKKKIRGNLKGWSFWSLRFFPHFLKVLVIAPS